MKKRISMAFAIVAAVLVVFSLTKHGDGSTRPVSAAVMQGLLQPVVSLTDPISTSTGAVPASLLQFKAGGHLLGFHPKRVYLVGLDHALSVEFLGTSGVMPKAADESDEARDRSGSPALGKVVYADLRQGINLVYEAREGGIAESTYEVAPGADVANIRLHYNLPVALQGYGSLRFQFERGYMSESPPVAWQEIDGNRVPVTAQFRVSGI